MPASMYSFDHISDPSVVQKIQAARKIIRRTLALYPADKVAFSFNGGKDSTVLLHLLRSVVHGDDKAAEESPGLGGIRSFIFTHPDDFGELHDFVRGQDARYGLSVAYLDDKDFKGGLVAYLARTGAQAILLGTRRDDPNAGDQQFFCPSSDGWPPFMRVNPVFDWTYHDVWVLLRATRAQYCALYDVGYTSLGSRFNTVPNSALLCEDGTYAPAYLLTDGRLERAGRAAKAPQQQPDELTGGGSEGVAVSPGSRQRHTAALLLVGDELLAGKVADTNAAFLCGELHAIGFQVAKLVVVRDDAAAIAAEVAALSPAVEVLLTCGGIGPTLDDVTMEGIAQGLGLPLSRHPEFEARLRALFGAGITPSHLKMAETPTGPGAVSLIDYALDTGEQSRFPLVKCAPNIYVLPGVPHLMRQKWRAVRAILQATSPAQPFHNQVFRLSEWDETRIAVVLQRVQHEAGSAVAVGSYPVVGQRDGAQILVTLDSREEGALRAASVRMRELLPAGSIVAEEAEVAVLNKPGTPTPAPTQQF
mmetsp:Transcript_21225/g.53960  ORF Transcript_21225/g.53960 Transcript_21225/m.53960 type:complete len:533 (-) Transcript_21225:676-2274(-)